MEIDFKFTQNELNRAMTKILKSTCPIFELRSSASIKFLGSCVLFKISNKHYLFSASHVFDEKNVQQYTLGLSKRIISLVQNKFYTSNLYHNKSLFNNKIEVDIAIVELQNDTIKMIYEDGEKHFIELENLAINQKKANDWYIACGFPETKVKLNYNNEKEFNLGTLSFLTKESSTKHYEKYDISPKLHIVSDYNKKMYKIGNNQKSRIPNLEGISGGGLWSLRRTVNGVIPKLSGILSDYRSKNRPVVISNRIENYSEFLRSYIGIHSLPLYDHEIQINWVDK